MRSARRSRLSLLTPLSSHSGLGSSPPRAGVRRADDLRHVRLHLPVAPHHRSGLALLQAADGRGPGSAGLGSSASRPLQTPGQEERVTSSLMSIPAPALSVVCSRLLCGNNSATMLRPSVRNVQVIQKQ